MATLSLTLPDELATRLAVRAKQSGYSSIEEYAKALLASEADEELEVDEDLEQLLLHRIQSEPSIQMTDGFFNQLRADIAAQRARKNSKPK